jgi:hypothetical protein
LRKRRCLSRRKTCAFSPINVDLETECQRCAERNGTFFWTKQAPFAILRPFAATFDKVA